MHAFDKLHEECGVFGIYLKDGKTGVVPAAYHALYALQHRGQESCGIAVNNDGVIDCYKDVGLVNEVFTRDVLEKLHEGSMAVGHCRYGTTGTQSRGNAQPLLVNHLKGALALCHNGNLVNARELREELELGGAIFHTTSDTEVIAYIITQERLRCDSIEQAVLRAMERIEGAYSLVIMSPQKLIAARDPHGFRPLCMGDLDGDVVFASESCALDAIGATFVRDIEPGETVVVSAEGIKSLKCGRKCDSSLCVFEFIYFARPDSVVDGSSVHVARLRAGAFLALDHPVQADVVIGVPDSGLDAALGYAKQSGIPYGVGFVKSKYIGRTFIQPGQARRGANCLSYLKQSETIADFLTAVGAPVAALDVISAKVERDMRNEINRKVNCDTANADKVVAAAQEQIDAIRRIERDYGLDVLPEKLQSAALLRIANPEASLADLATLSYPPVTKSCLNYRLKKLMEFHMDD